MLWASDVSTTPIGGTLMRPKVRSQEKLKVTFKVATMLMETDIRLVILELGIAIGTSGEGKQQLVW